MSETLRQLSGYVSGVSQRLRDILSNLKQKEDPSVQLIALSDLSELLLISNEDNLSGHFSPDQFIKELKPLMEGNEFGEENPEMMLLACRCIANMMEALPTSTAVVVYSGAVSVLCQKLLQIDFIDLAEQSLSALEKISVEFPSSIVREGGLSACLNFLDFFATSTQRTAVTTAANCCKGIPHDSYDVVKDVMPTLLTVLTNTDQKVVEQGSICVCRIVESFRNDYSKLESLVSVELLKAIRRLLQPGTTNLIGPSIHTQFLRVLTITAQASPKLSAELLKMEVVDTLYQILTGVSPPSGLEDMTSQIDSILIMQTLIHRPREQISETLNVICELLPPVQKERLSIADALPPPMLFDDDILPYRKIDSPRSNEQRLATLQDCFNELKRFAIVMFPTLTDAFSSTVNLAVRQKVLTAQLKMLSNLDCKILEASLRTVPYASFLASILSQQDHPSLVRSALQAADLLLNRQAKIYGYQFYREGVMTEISKIADQEITKAEPKAAAVKPEPVVEAPPKLPSAADIILADRSIHGINDQGNTEYQEVEPMEQDDEDEEGDNDDDQDHDDEDDDDDDVAREIQEDSPSPSESSTSEQDYHISSIASDRDYTIMTAKKFMEVHETSNSKSMKENASRIMKRLQSLAKAISSCYTKDRQQEGDHVFSQMSDYFKGDALTTITSSELLQSEVIDALLDVLSSADGKSPCPRMIVSVANPTSGNVKRKARSDFLRVFMKSGKPSPGASASMTPFSVFIHKLQDLLSRAERFEVLTVSHNAFDNNRSNPSSMLSKQIRLRLVSDDQSEPQKSYNDQTLSVHAIAPLKQLDDYLRPRISLAERPRGYRHRDGVSHAIAAMAVATGVPGLQHRSADASGIPSEPPSQQNPSDGPSTSRTPRKLVKSKKSDSKSGPTPEPEKASTSRRSSRRHLSKSTESRDAPPPPPPPPERVQTPLECADEHQVTDDDDDDDEDDDDEDIDGSSALDAIVDDFESSLNDERAAEPGAVNMEVASTGKVTARKEDGTRVATPLHGAGIPPTAQKTPSSRTREVSASHLNFAAARGGMSYADAIQATPQDWHLEFSVDGRPVPTDMTIYRAIHQNDLQRSSTTARNVWSTTHTVKFKRVEGPPPKSSLTPKSSTSSGSTQDELPASLHGHPQTSKILRLLNMFHQMNTHLEDVLDANGDHLADIKAEPLSQFVNTKLTAKLNRQLEEPLIVASNCLPDWSQDLARLYPFLFPFETRHLFLQSTSFGYDRSMTRWQNQSTEESRHRNHRDDRPYMNKLLRQKVRISRTRILESAYKVLELYAGSPSILEIEYFHEVGTGLGPTLEFYSSVSKEFSKKKTKLWRLDETDEQDEYAFSKYGLFPAPMTAEMAESEAGRKILTNFRTLGKFIARSMLDSRIIDVSLNPTFFRVGDQPSTVPLSLGAVKTVDEQLAKSLKLLKQYANAKTAIESNRGLSATQRSREIKKITIDGAAVEDLGLDFTLPGYPQIELVEDGANKAVTIENAGEYVDKVIDLTLGSGVQRQVDQFREGFSEIFAYSALRAFTPNELVMLFGRVEEDWSMESESMFPRSFSYAY